MTNEEKKTNTGTTEATTSEDTRNESQTPELIRQANEAAQRLEQANAKREELIKREEELKIKQIFGGKSELTEEQIPKEEDPRDYASKILSGQF